MLSGNKYTSRSSLGSAIISVSNKCQKKIIYLLFATAYLKVTKMCFSKGRIL